MQTAIEYLEKEYNENKGFLGSSNFEQAKEMEKNQIIDAWEMGRFNIDALGNGEEYYQETFKKD